MENIKIFNKNSKNNKNNYNFLLKDQLKINLLIKFFLMISILIILLNININKNNILSYHSKLSKNLNKTNEINEEFIKNLKCILNEDEIIENAMMSKYTTFRIGGPAKYLVKPKIISQIIEIIKLCN